MRSSDNGLPLFLASYDDKDDYWSTFNNAIFAINYLKRIKSNGVYAELEKKKVRKYTINSSPPSRVRANPAKCAVV